MKGYVYILQSDDGKYYTGSTTDVQSRLKRHLGGYVYTTFRMKNPRLVFSQDYDDIGKAKKVERWLKALKRKDYLEKIISEGHIRKNF